MLSSDSGTLATGRRRQAAKRHADGKDYKLGSTTETSLVSKTAPFRSHRHYQLIGASADDAEVPTAAITRVADARKKKGKKKKTNAVPTTPTPSSGAATHTTTTIDNDATTTTIPTSPTASSVSPAPSTTPVGKADGAAAPPAAAVSTVRRRTRRGTSAPVSYKE